MKDAVRVVSNRSGLAHQIAPDSAFDEGKPDHMRLYRATKGTAYDATARALSDAICGTATQAGGIDVSPETLKFWTRALTGGTCTFLADTARFGQLAATAAADDDGDLWPDLREIPVVRRLVREPDVRDARSAYWQAERQAMQASADLSRARCGRDDDGEEKVRREAQAALDIARSFVRFNRHVKRIRDEADDIMQDDSIPLGRKRVEIKELERQERELYDEALKAWRETAAVE